MKFKFGYDRPKQAPVPTPNHPCAIQYRPMLEFYPQGGSWWARPPETFEVYLGGTLMGKVGLLRNAGWGAWAHGLNEHKGLGIFPTRAQAAWLVLNRVWIVGEHLVGRNDVFTKVYRRAPGNVFAEYLGHVVELKWDGFAVYPRGCERPTVYAETKHKALVVLAGYWKAGSS